MCHIRKSQCNCFSTVKIKKIRDVERSLWLVKHKGKVSSDLCHSSCQTGVCISVSSLMPSEVKPITELRTSNANICCLNPLHQPGHNSLQLECESHFTFAILLKTLYVAVTKRLQVYYSRDSSVQ